MFLLNTGSTTFLASGMKKSKRWPDQTQPQLWDEVRVALATPVPMPRLNPLLCQHHYLGSLRPAGRRLCSIAPKASGRWVAVLVFSAAAKHLKPRDEWIGWSEEQRRRPLSLATNNSRFLLLPDSATPSRPPDHDGLPNPDGGKSWRGGHAIGPRQTPIPQKPLMNGRCLWKVLEIFLSLIGPGGGTQWLLTFRRWNKLSSWISVRNSRR
jgi:hypothetical protein